MRVHFAEDGWEDYVGWSTTDQGVLRKINALIEDIWRSPHAGLGKPEPLKGDLSGWWSRRITGEHRLVYRVEGKRGEDQRVEILMCKFHY